MWRDRLQLWRLGIVIWLCSSCDVAPPNFVEISAPRGTIDALGPYAFSAKITGAVDIVRVKWLIVTPESENQEVNTNDFDQANTLSFSQEGELWTAELIGGARVAKYYYFFEAIGPGGSRQEPLGGVDSFEVNALMNQCLGDSDCLIGEVCHRRENYCYTPPTPCTDDAHCPRDRICNLDTGFCRFQDSICENDQDCDEGYVCQENQCTPILIEPPPPLFCDPPCEEGNTCQEGVCIPNMAGCTADGQCDEGFACNLAIGQCEAGERGVFCQPCDFDSGLEQAGCGVGFNCREGVPGCRPQCGNRGPNQPECGEDERCDNGLCISTTGICGSNQCVSHADCDSGQCDRGRCTEIQSCTSDDDCINGVCLDQQCLSEPLCDLLTCPENSICLGGRCRIVEEESSTCALCRLDEDCLGLSHCMYFSGADMGRCYSLCTIDAQCQSGELCYFSEARLGYCGPAGEQSFDCETIMNTCESDEFEPNDQLPQATPLMLPDSGTVSLEGLQMCSLDDDFYYLIGSEGISYQVNILTEAPSQLYLYDEQGELIAEFSNVFPVPEGITFELSGSRFLQVQSINEMSTSYQIRIAADQVMTICSNDDNLEENDTLDDSYPIGAGADLILSLCPADEDWFMIRGRQGELWSVELFLRAFIGEVELSIGTQQEFLDDRPLSWFYMSEGDQLAEYVLEEAEPYYIRIRCLNCTETFRYQLGLSR